MAIIKIDKFMAVEDGFFFPICNYCKNKYKYARCKAFNKIPDEILNGARGHLKPLPNQENNIVFERVGE